jgi:two-component system, OmpR family, sensor kinase
MMTMMTTTMTTMTTTTTMTTEPTRRGRWWSSIRLRIVVGYVVLVAAALAISILVTRQVLLGRLDRDIDRALVQEVEELRNLATGNDPTTGEPFGADAEAILDTFLRRNVPGPERGVLLLRRTGNASSPASRHPQEVWSDEPLVELWASVTEPVRATASTDVGEIQYLAVPLIAAARPPGSSSSRTSPARTVTRSWSSCGC